jgi:hypothetical protein
MRNAFVVVSMILLSGCGPRDYDDCILENMRGINDTYVATVIQRSCRDKFPEEQESEEVEQECVLREMTAEEKTSLEIKGGIGHIPNYLVFSIYNHNTVSELRQFTVLITAPNYKFSQEYSESTLIAPKSARDRIGISVAETPSAPWGFVLVSAKTCSR